MMIQPMQLAKGSSESAEQQALFCWAALAKDKYPELALMYAIPNQGNRGAKNGGRMKAEGMRAGVPDIFLPAARRKMVLQHDNTLMQAWGRPEDVVWHGLYIEMKYGNNKQTDEQQKWSIGLQLQGYCVTVAYSWQEAADIIQNYLKGTYLHGK